jgi:hypothetical protein
MRALGRFDYSKVMLDGAIHNLWCFYLTFDIQVGIRTHRREASLFRELLPTPWGVVVHISLIYTLTIIIRA